VTRKERNEICMAMEEKQGLRKRQIPACAEVMVRNGNNQEGKMTGIEEVKNTLAKMESQFSMVLPPQIPLERFIRVAQTAIQTNPGLIECNRNTLYAACMKAATDGLLPDGREAALVSFKGFVQYMPMVSGILKKIRNSGLLESIAAHIVYEDDEFRYWVDEQGEHIYHQPNWDNSGEVKLVYAIARTKDNGVYIEVMTVRQVEAVRNISKAKESGPWATWWDEMAKKSVIRRLAKRLPMSTDVEQIFESDNDNYIQQPEQEAAEPVKKKSRLEMIVEAEVEPVAEPDTEPVRTGATVKGKNYKFMEQMQVMKKNLGDEFYYGILKNFGVTHCNEIIDRETQLKIYAEMKKFIGLKKEVEELEKEK
jgi:phage RecT family recombinase